MKPRIRRPIVTALCLLLAACATTPQKVIDRGGRQITGDQLIQLLTGSTIVMQESRTSAKITLLEDGTVKATNSDFDSTTGQWSVTGDQFCLAFRSWGMGEKRCFLIYEDKSGYLQFNSKGLLRGSFTVVTLGSGVVTTPIPPTPVVPPSRLTTVTPPPEAAEPVPATVTAPSAPLLHADLDNNHAMLVVARDCPGCNFAGADFSGAALRGARLQGANLLGTDLSHADLAGADLSHTNLDRADLRGANLSGADLSEANLAGARFDNARLDGATMTGANTHGATGLP